MRALSGSCSFRTGGSGAIAISLGSALTFSSFFLPSGGPQSRRVRPSYRRGHPPLRITEARGGQAADHPPFGFHSNDPPERVSARRRPAPRDAPDSLLPMRLPVPLAAEIVAARAAGRLSRLAGAGGGTTMPGKLLWKLDPGAVDRLAARLPLGSALISATNGKTTTAAMAAAILEPRLRLAHNRAGANLVSGVASALLDARDAQLGLFEVDEAALPEVAARVGPRAICLGNLFRDQLDRYGELEHVAERWRTAVERLDRRASLVVNGDDPQVGDLARRRADAIVFGVDDPRHGRPSLQHAADSKYCVRCGTPYVYGAAYVGHLGDYRCPACGHARPPLTVRATGIELHG